MNHAEKLLALELEGFYVEAPAGSVLVFDDQPWHDGGVNYSSSRWGFSGA